MAEKQIRFRMEAGMGDSCHAAAMCCVLKNRGYDVTVSVNSNRDFIFDCAGIHHIPMNPSEVFHKWKYLPQWGSFDVPVWISNKPMMGFADDCIPDIGDQKEIWKEICQVRISADGHISEEATKSADDFINDLPRPLLALHSCGQSFSQKKNLDHQTTIQLMNRWLEETGGSIIQLNADKSEPSFRHERVKTHKSWRRIGLDWLCALYYECDLMIGVDSGPFHLASFTDVPCLGVFRQIQPIHCAIPNPNAWYLVSDIHHDVWDKNKQDWQFIEYHGPEPDADAIFSSAKKRIGEKSFDELAELSQEIGFYE